MKRVVSFGLCILMLTVMAMPAMAAETTCFSMSASSDILHRGDTVTFTVAVSGGAPATSYGFLLSYDSAVFQLVDGSCTVSGTLISSFHNGFAFMFQNPTAYSGTVGTVTFRVKEDAAFGSVTVSGTASVKNGSATVSASGASKTVEISCGHSYSGWSEANDTFHKRKCAMCGKEETAYHSWDNGNITRQPTSEEEGIMTYTCSICNAVKTESIPKLNDQKCGDNLMWTLDDQGTLTIFGSGEMWGWVYPEFAPWYDQRSSIQKIVVEPGVTSIGLWAFYDCSNAESVTIPGSVTTIGEYAFFLCESLTEVTIPEGVTAIGESAFSWCTDLTSVTIPDGVTAIGESAFSRCSSLTDVTIPGSVTELGASAFEYCESLTNVNILSGVSRIGDEAFYYCTKLTNVNIGSNVKEIGKYAFAQCFGLTTVTLGNGIITIDEDAFYDCKNLTGITIPNSVISIGASAFSGCASMSSAVIGTGVTSIGNGAFNHCSGLKEIIFKGHAPAIDMPIFSYVTATAYYPADDDSWTDYVRRSCGGTITWIASEWEPEPIASGDCGDNMTWTLDDEGILTIIGTGSMWEWTSEGTPWNAYKETIRKVVFTAADAKGADAANSATNTTGIGAWAFYACENLSEVELPENLVSIGDAAFCDCSSLAEIHFTGNAPAFGADVFSGVTAIVYYPENNETWTEEVLKDCGGNITLVPEVSYTVGDANNDGTVNPLDALMLLQCYIGMVDVEALTFAACDCNGDGTVNPLDALVVLQYYVGMIEKFPVA